MVAVKTPPHERQAGRRKLAAQGHALSDGSFPIPNTGYLKKAIRAVGRAAPGKRPALARLIRKRARALGSRGMSILKGSWADNRQSAQAMANALGTALELARLEGTLWELAHLVDLASPAPGEMDGVYKRALARTGSSAKAMAVCRTYAKRKGYPSSAVKAEYSQNGHRRVIGLAHHVAGEPFRYKHGWIPITGPMGHQAKLGEHVRVQRLAGPAEGQVIHRGAGGAIHIRTKSGQRIESHTGMITHVRGKGAPSGGGADDEHAKLRAHMIDVHKIAAEHHAGLSHNELVLNHSVDHQSTISKQRGLANHPVTSRRHKTATREALTSTSTLPGIKEAKAAAAKPSPKAPAAEKPRPLRIAGKRMTAQQTKDFNALSDSEKDGYEEARQEDMGHAEALALAKRGTELAKARKTPAPKSAPAPTSAVSHTAHADLLKARTAARAQYPKGHPERLKAERAVRHSRKTRRAGAGGDGGTTRSAGVPRSSRRRRTPVPAGTTSAPEKGGGKSIEERQAEVNKLLPSQKRTYAQAKRQGVGHERAMGVARGRPEAPKGTAGRKRQIAEKKQARAGTLTRKAAPTTPIPTVAPGGPKDEALAKRLGVPVGQIAQIRALAKSLAERGWSVSEARKLAVARVTKGTPIPQYAPGRKGPRQK